MKIKLFGVILFLIILSPSVFSQKEDFSTIKLKEARQLFVGKSVKIFGSKYDSDGKLRFWHFAEKQNGRYECQPYYIRKAEKLQSTKLPLKYRWQTATIVAIELDEDKIPKRNALGE